MIFHAFKWIRAEVISGSHAKFNKIVLTLDDKLNQSGNTATTANYLIP